VGAWLEKAGQGWRWVKPYLAWVMRWVKILLGFALICLLVAGAIWALIYVPGMQVPVCPQGQEGLPPKIYFDIENEARKTLAYILAGILAIIGIYTSHRRMRALERQVLVAQEGQITERFTRAIEQLGNDRMEIRLGGIYALERIANDSNKDYWPIMETLTAFVRENAPWREQTEDETGKISAEEAVQETLTRAPEISPKPATDIQAILTVLGRCKYRYGRGEEERLDLCDTALRGANLWRAHLEGVALKGAHLEKAALREAHLEGAYLREAHLEGAYLAGAHLEGADLWGAHLEGAFLVGAHLEEADLRGAHLEGAGLGAAHLKGADLKRAYLKGAFLRGATGLTREQLADAIIDKKTRLPDYLQEEPPEAKGPKGDGKE
jgi:uncharacterized protein YjbI with pentapeptide repeats